MLPPIEHHRVETNGIALHVVTAGPVDGPMVLLLHGFPEFWYGFRRQIAPLAAAGFRVVVPDQRGYGVSDKPRGLSAYRLRELGRDALGLIDAFDRDQAIVVGHDWGGAVAWWLAMEHPERVTHLVALNIPHPLAFLRGLATRTQLAKSWYMFFFQLPILPMWRLARADYQPLLDVLVKLSKPGSFTTEDLEVYRSAYRQPGALRGMLAWYRAAFQRPPLPMRTPRVHVPTLIIWGRNDRALGEELAHGSLRYCDDVRLELVDDAGHFVALDASDEVNRQLLAFLADATASQADGRDRAVADGDPRSDGDLA